MSVNILFIAFVVLAILSGWLLFSRKGRRVIHRVSNGDGPPHKNFPEVLHWKRGDKFDGLYFAKWSKGYLMSVTENGFAYLKFCDDEWCMSVSSLVGHNQSLQNRRINESIQQSGEYMELLEQFNKSFMELEERDRKNGVARK